MKKVIYALLSFVSAFIFMSCSFSGKGGADGTGGNAEPLTDEAAPPAVSRLIQNVTDEQKLGTINRGPMLPNISGLYIGDMNQDGTYRDLLNNFNNMYHPQILKIGTQYDSVYPYRMYFFGWCINDTNLGWPGCDATFYARGKNLDNWEVYCGKDAATGEPMWDSGMNTPRWVPVITADVSMYYDNWHTGDMSVVFKGGLYYAAFSAYGTNLNGQFYNPSVNGSKGDLSCVAGATSTDGITWKKITKGPLLIWKDEVGKDCPIVGGGTDYTNAAANPYYGMYHRPELMYDYEEGIWKLWWDYLSYYNPSNGANHMSMGYAENYGDPMNPDDWVKIRYDGNPCISTFPNPSVVKVKGKYYAYGDPDAVLKGAGSDLIYPSGWPCRQLVEAQSDDGINWKVTGFIDPDTDNQASQIPCLYYEDGILYITYATMKGNRGEPQYNTFGNGYFNSGTYDYRQFAIRYKARFLDYQNEKGVTYGLKGAE